MNDIEKKLQAPFKAEEIEWRIQNVFSNNTALVLAYVTNRAIQDRFDEVFGVFGWMNEYKEWHGDSQLCGISVYDKEKDMWITKWDGADKTNFEETKGGLSDSMKRCAVQFGVGRYLYKLTASYVALLDEKPKAKGYKTHRDKGKQKYWYPPKLPAWALPENEVDNIGRDIEEQPEEQPKEQPKKEQPKKEETKQPEKKQPQKTNVQSISEKIKNAINQIAKSKNSTVEETIAIMNIEFKKMVGFSLQDALKTPDINILNQTYKTLGEIYKKMKEANNEQSGKAKK